MNSPSHEAVSRRAAEIWQMRGNPSGHDLAIWLEAEQQVLRESPHSPLRPAPELVTGEVGGPFTHLSPGHSPAPDPDVVAAQAARQKQSSRVPHLPSGKKAPKPAPAETGKPLWPQPHSS